MSDDSDNNLGDSLTSDDEDFGFGDEDDDSDFESSQPISSRKTSGRVNDSLGSRNSNFARSRGGRSSDGPPSRGRSSWQRDVSQTSDDEEFEDLEFGMDDDDDDEEDFAPRGAALKRGGSGRDSRGRGGRGRGGSFSGRDPVPGRFWAAADDDFEPEGIYPSPSVTIRCTSFRNCLFFGLLEEASIWSNYTLPFQQVQWQDKSISQIQV